MSKRSALGVFFLLFSILVISVTAVIGCSAVANCPGGGIAWCRTFGNCGAAPGNCYAMDGQYAYCTCNGVETYQYCAQAV